MTGDLRTFDSHAPALALQKLLEHPCPEDEELLFHIATAPDQKTADPTASGRETVRAAAMELVRSAASEAFRVRLARAMIAPDASPETCDRLWNCLQEPRPENLAAQVVLFQSDRLDSAIQERLEQCLLAQSGGAASRLLGIPPPKRRAADSEKPPVATDPYRAAERLWSSHFATAIQRRLSALESLEKGPRLVTLASTVPVQSVRAACSERSRSIGTRGPRAWNLPTPRTASRSNPAACRS